MWRESYWQTIAVEVWVVMVLGWVPAAIAGKKGYSFLKWWLFGWAVFIVALPWAISLTPKNVGQKPDERTQGQQFSRFLIGLLSYLGFGVLGILAGNVLPIFFDSILNGGLDNGRGLGPVQTLLCFAGGLALCAYSRRPKVNEPMVPHSSPRGIGDLVREMGSEQQSSADSTRPPFNPQNRAS
jgi:hypothetical protein